METSRNTCSANTINGTAVRNMQDQDVGMIEDVMINLQDGSVAYLVLSYGGIFGTRWADKRFAVPFAAFQMEKRDKDVIYRLDVNKESLENAPGFDKDRYPDFADPQFSRSISDFYSGLTKPRRAA